MVARAQVTAMPMEKSQRVLRSPSHPFHIRHRPFQLVPFMIAPVIPGETLKNLTFQSRCVTDPIKNALIGWHLEHYFFYVKFRDLPATESTALQAMMVTPGRAMTDIDDVTFNVDWYHPGDVGSINFTKLCTQVVTEWWFRDNNEAWNSNLIGNYPAVSVKGNSWLDSMRPVATDAALDFNVDLNADASIKASEVEEAMRRWEMLRMAGLTLQTYEEYLMTHGVAQPATEVNKPELIRYTSQWQYPSNTVEPTTGVPTSAVSWSVAERADKDRFFREPGFLVGFSCARPKVYRASQQGAAAHILNDVYAWLPATLRGQMNIGTRTYDNANALLLTQTTDFNFDTNDLFLYGDQFCNFSLTITGEVNATYNPTAAGVWQYLTATQVDTFFKSASPANQIRQDGIVNLQILGAVPPDRLPGVGTSG